MVIGPFWCFGLTQWELGYRWVLCSHKRRVGVHDLPVRLNGLEAVQEMVLSIISTLGPWGLPRKSTWPPVIYLVSLLLPFSLPFPLLLLLSPRAAPFLLVFPLGVPG